MVIKLLLLLLFFGSMVGVGIYCRKGTTDVNGFVLGGRAVGPWLTAFSYGTSYFSAVIFVGYAGQFGYKFGIASTWIGIGNALIGSMLAWIVLGKRSRVLSHHYDTSTMAEYFGARFNNKSLQIGAALITFIFLIPYTASLYNGLSRLFTMAFNIDYAVCIIIMALLTAVYVVFGGYMATAINDFIQGMIMIFGIVAVIVAVIMRNGGFTTAINTLSHVEDLTISTQAGVFTSFFGPEPLNLLAVIILTSLGTWGLPQMVTKYYAITDEKAINKGMVISTFFAFVVAGGCYFLGGFGRLYNIDIQTSGYDAIIPTMLTNLPDLLIGVIVILVLSASMSTLSSLVMASSSTLTVDLIKDNLIKKMDEKKQVLWIRCLIVVFILISVIIAIVQYKSKVTFIAQLMGISWGALAGAFLAPFLFSLYSKKITAASTWCCFIFSVTLMVSNMLFRSTFPTLLQSPINCAVLAMLSGFIIVPVVSLFTKKPHQEQVDAAFDTYNQTVEVPVKENLGN